MDHLTKVMIIIKQINCISTSVKYFVCLRVVQGVRKVIKNNKTKYYCDQSGYLRITNKEILNTILQQNVNVMLTSPEKAANDRMRST